MVWRVARSPPLTIDLFGSEEAQRAFRQFTAPHERLRVVRSKTFGVALLPIPRTRREALGGANFRNLRQRRQRALSRGYTFRSLDALERLGEILAIHCSVDKRQGKPLAPGYLDPARVRRYCASSGSFFGVFDADNVLRAYCHVPVLGDVFAFARILGQYDRLKDGVMYLLVSEAVVTMRAELDKRGYPCWAMYDMFIGGGAGLRIFKKECGFRPYRVVWRWRNGTA